MTLFTSSKAMLLVMALLVIMASNAPSGVVMAQPGEKEQDEPMMEVVQLPETEPPVPAPTEAPVPAPTEAPVPAPTEAPVPAPTEAPVVAPTEPPVPAPTDAPVVAPTEPPVPAPTEPPVAPPTEPPVPPPTEAPVAAPTEPPVVVTQPPVPAPTEPPVVVTQPPVAAPTEPVPETPEPTSGDFRLPTVSPTAAPVEPVVPVPPTAAPVAATPAPTTAAPTASPTMPLPPFGPETVKGLGIALDGVVLPLSDEAIATFESTYALHCTDFFAADIEQVSKDVEDYSTTITYVDDEPLRRRRRRSLRMTVRSVEETGTGSVLVTYDQELQYRADPEKVDLTKAVEAPFKTVSRRQTFADLLVASGDPAYENLEGVGKLIAPGSGQDPKSNTNAIIIGVCAGVGGLLLLAGGYMLYKRQAGKSSSKGDVVGDDEKPPLAVSTAGGDDGVSTLAEPAGPGGTQSGDQSVATVDYDYSKAYGGGGEGSVVSSAGGTLGQQTSGGGTLGTAAAAGVAAAGGASIFSDDASFEQSYAGQNVSVREEMIEIYAPPGKLGVVIDTPDEGAPVVHAIKDSSCIADQLQVGDKLIAVDDEDVRAMTAIKVSKMISRKSANAQRKLTIVRTTVSG